MQGSTSLGLFRGVMRSRFPRGRSARRSLRVALVFSLFLGSPLRAGAQAVEAPRRIVSINLCADQYVMQLAAPEDIVSVSFVAADPTVSVMWKQARRHRLNRGSTEEVLALRPDLVVSMAGRNDRTRFMLERLGVRYLQLPVPDNLAALRGMIVNLAAELGRPGLGAALLGRLDRALAEMQRGQESRKPKRVLFYGPNGYTFGPDTLIGELVDRAGWTDAAQELGISAYGEVRLEQLLMAPPDLLVLLDASGASLAQRQLRHPALLGRMKGRLARFPQRFVLCPGPWTVAALRERMLAWRNPEPVRDVR